MLLDAGADAGRADKDGRTPLAWAAWSGRLHALAPLLALCRTAPGANATRSDGGAGGGGAACPHGVLEARDKAGRTPLALAAARGHADVAKRLLAWGADAGARDRTGRDVAELARRAGHAELLELFAVGVTV